MSNAVERLCGREPESGLRPLRPFAPEALDFLSVFARLDGFRDGHLDVTGVVFLVSVTVVCLWGAVLLPDPGVRAGKEGMTREKP